MRTKRYDVFVTLAASYDLEDIEEWLERHETEDRAAIVVDGLLDCIDSTQVFVVAVFRLRRNVKSVMMSRALR